MTVRSTLNRCLPLAILLVYAFAIAVHYDLTKTQKDSDSAIAQIIYLPQSSYLKPLSFGYASLLSDFIYIWSIQYYGDRIFNPRMQFLPHTYNLITELDPQFLDAYETGALF